MPWERDVDVRIRAQHGSERRVADSNWRSLRGTRDGAALTADWLQALIIEGRGFCAGIGLLSEGEALQAAGITTLRPMLWVRVPTGTSIMPFYAAVQVEDSGGANSFEIAIGTEATDVGDGSSSAADYGPVNLRTGSGRGSNCVPRQEATGDVTADADCDLRRAFTATDTNAEAVWAKENYEWNLFPCGVLDGPATWMLYCGAAAAPTVTAQVQWVEFDSDEI